MMKNSDEAVERVLAGLRDADAPVGMERRILEKMRTSGRRERLVIASHLVGIWTRATAVAGVIVVASVMCWTAFREHRPGHDNMGSKRQIIPTNLPDPETQTAAARAQQSLPKRPVVRRKSVRRVGVAREGESAALHVMHAASYPAPEAPLTKEERLLIRMAHRADPAEMAALNPFLWAVRDAKEKAEVRRFFESRTTGDDK
jgi:hypothetical protein